MSPCVWCGQPLQGVSIEFCHPDCLPKAAEALKTLSEMARRRYGTGFQLGVYDAGPGNPPHVVDLNSQGVHAHEVVDDPEMEKRLDEAVKSEIARIQDLEEIEDLEELLPDPCLCEKDADDRCPKCIGTIIGFVEGMTRIMSEQEEKVSKLTSFQELCGACASRNADYALAKITVDLLRPLFEKVGSSYARVMTETITAMKAQFVRKFGVMKWPLLDKAIRDQAGA